MALAGCVVDCGVGGGVVTLDEEIARTAGEYKLGVQEEHARWVNRLREWRKDIADSFDPDWRIGEIIDALEERFPEILDSPDAE